ncbi:MAG TPA: hypothetical protein VKN36_18855, partial [Eudoraea sp.]|nr:hypothetical protein [Eudoraea sp.]
MMMKKPGIVVVFLTFILAAACSAPGEFDILIKNGQLVDGSGKAGYTGDLAINADTIAALGDLSRAAGRVEIDATGLTIAPGFINMLSWANVSLIEDGRSQGDIRQGVTLEVMGEGHSMGPLNEEMKQERKEGQQHITYDIPWTTLGEYLEYLERKGVATNIASLVGNGT